MQPTKLSIAELFEHREQYLIPLFQRGYVWSLASQIQPLWEDLVDRMDALTEHRANAQKVGGADKLRPLRKHFLGAIVVGTPTGADSETIATREVIDGQQRITTLQIMLLALRDVVKALDDVGLADDIATLTFNKGRYRLADNHMKVWPTNAGRDVMKALASTGGPAEICKAFPAKVDKEKIKRPLMVQAYLFFYAMLDCLGRGKRIDDPMPNTPFPDDFTVARAIIRSIESENSLRIPFATLPANSAPLRRFMDALQQCFQIMRLQLDAEDDPQIIFESLNARGVPLQPSDLIRNFLFLRASRQGEDVDKLYEDYWKGFDEKPENGEREKGAKFWKKEERQGRLKNSRLDLLLYHYVSLRKREEIKVSHVFEEFKDWWETEDRNTNVELIRLIALAKRFEVFVSPDQKSRLGRFCRCMNLLDTATQTPLVFYMLEHHDPDSAELAGILDDLESYLVRRFICGLTTKGYNRIFLARLLTEIASKGATDRESLRNKLLMLEGDSQRWPTDDEFEAAWLHRQLYQGSNTRKVRAVLEGLEMALRTKKQEFMPELTSLSVEHVLPQGWKAEDWPLPADTAEARATRARLLHSIGNLTLVTSGFNSALSNAPFSEKRPELAANSSLVLNAYFQGLQDTSVWDEDSIILRARILLATAKSTWARPNSL